MNNIFESIEPVISKHLNNKISKARINQLLNESKLYHSLLEKYGIRDYDNFEHINQLEDITSEIYNFIIKHRNDVEYDSLLYNDVNMELECKMFSFELKHIDWLSKLNILVSFEIDGISKMKHDEIKRIYSQDYYNQFISSTENVYATIGDSLIYNSIQLDNGSFRNYIDNCKYNCINMKTRKQIELFRKTKKSIETATILIQVPNIFKLLSERELVFVLKHELSHINDMLYKDMSIFNTDKVEQQVIGPDEHTQRDYIFLNNYNQENNTNFETLYNLLMSFKTKSEFKQLIENKDKDRTISMFISDVIVNNIEYLNLSEIKAYLNQFQMELTDKINPYRFHILNKKYKADIRQINMLEYISDFYALYVQLKRILEFFKEYTISSDKHIFEEEFIFPIINRKRDIGPGVRTPEFMYNRKFNSFDAFMDFLIDRIQRHFIRHANHLAYDVIDYKAQEDPDFEKLRENHRFIKNF